MAIRRTSAATTINRGVSAAAATPVNIITGSGGTGATVNISSIQIANSGFTVIDDTAVNTTGGYIIINGTGFQSGATVRVQGTSATSVAFVSSSRLNVTVPAISSGTLDIYVINPDGSGAILLSGFVSSGTPTWTTTSPLTSQDVETAFSIQLAATGDGSVTYAVSSGSTLPSGTSLASNGLFSGTVTGLQQETTYTFSVDAIDSQNQETARTFNITITAGDVYYYLTTLHLSGEAPANNWISDISTNKFALTVNGDTKPVAFSPYETVWSNFFDGTGDYLSLSSATPLRPENSDFTLECWIYITSPSDSPIYESRTGNSGSTDGFTLTALNSTVIRIFTTSAILSATVDNYSNKWTHVAVVRNSGTTTLYINGTSGGTTTSLGNLNGTDAVLIGGGRYTSGAPISFNGYISNFRLVKGTAVYTANFTPPTSPLTAISGTSLLTCQSNRLIDNSTNNLTITKNGDVTVTTFGPFTETDLVTGSAYFDGTGDNLVLPTNATPLQPGTGDYTIELFYYATAHAASGENYRVIFSYNSGSGIPLRVFFQNTNGIDVWESATLKIRTSNTSTLNQWNHLAICRSGSTTRAFYNGTSIGDFAGTTDLGGTLNIGNDGASGLPFFTGYMSNFRVLKGTALYTTNFTPPASPLTAVTNTSLLTLQNRFGENNNRIIDTSGINSIVTRNGNVLQGTSSPFSQTGWSGYFTGSSTSYISTPGTTIADQGQAYTAQCWIYPTSFTTSTSAVRRMYIFIKGVIYAGLSIHSDGTLGWYGWPTPGGIIVNSAAGTITTNAWQHVALVVNPGNYIKLFKNGVEVGNSAYTAAGAGSAAIQIGHGDTGQSTDGFIGYISNFKINQSALTSGQLDYSSSPTISSNTGASVLTLQTNRFNDTSANNLTITSGGAPTVQAFSPFKPTTEWSANTVGGSMYFDGTGDYLTVPDNTALDAFTDFTIEFWVYFNSVSGTQVVLDKGWNNATIAPYLIFQTDGGMVAYASSAGSWDVLSGSSFGTLTAGQWYHIALTRSGSSIRLFRNGAVITTVTNGTAIMNGASALGIGGSPSSGANPLNGYISNLRIVKGSALYTSAFTPPTSPPTPVSGTVLLLNGTNGGIIDYTSRNNLETVGNVQLSTSIKKFGNASMYFDGAGDYLKIPMNNNLKIGSGDYTIECWVYRNDASTSVFYVDRGGADFTGVLFAIPNNKVGMLVNLGSGWDINTFSSQQGSTNIPVTTWTHIAISRQSSSWRVFINGNLQYTSTGAGSVVQTNSSAFIGYDPGEGTIFNGYIDDLRITKGYARYTENFTPPTSTFKTK